MANEIDYPYYPFRIKIDIVLVSRVDNLSRQYHRNAFEEAIRKEGLIVSYERIHPFLFTLISCPFWRLCKEAERRVIYCPLKNVAVEPSHPTWCHTLSSIFVAQDSVNFISVPFQRIHGPLYINYENEKKFFSSAQRSMLTHQILCELNINDFIECSYEDSEKKEKKEKCRRSSLLFDLNPETLKRKGLKFLLLNDTYMDSFILHDPSEEEPYYKKMKNSSLYDFRQFLAEIEEDPRRHLSSVWSDWWRTQPLNMVRDYFGEQIAFYFAWQGTFCTLLWPAAFVGLGVFFFGLCKSITTSPQLFSSCFIVNLTGYSIEVGCNTRSKIAQIFSALSRWTLNSFDTELTAFFAVAMSIWGTVFFQIWQRNSSVLTYEWDCEQLAETEPDRAQFEGTSMQRDIVTGEAILIYPGARRFLKFLCSFIFVLFSMCIVVCSVLSVTLYKVFILNTLQCTQDFHFSCSLAVSFTPSLLNTLSTMILGTIYSSFVVRLTEWENHRTQSEYTNALIIKLFAFQFVNNYTSLFYIAFIRPERHNFQPHGLFGLGDQYKDVCKEGTCGSLLALQLIIHLVIKPFPKFTKDVIIPYFVKIAKMAKWRKREQTMEEMIAEREEKNVLIREWVKPDAGEFAFGEFSEKMLLFASTMMFAALFPLAPLFALFIGLADLRIDASRLVWFNRRPIPVRMAGIGIWTKILTFIQYAAVLTNAFIVAFTSEFCVTFFSGTSVECSVENRLFIVLILQNATFLLKYLLQSIIPTTPTELRVAQRRKRYVARYVSEQGNAPEKVFQKKSKLVKIAKIVTTNTRKNDSANSTTSMITTGRPKIIKVKRIGRRKVEKIEKIPIT